MPASNTNERNSDESNGLQKRSHLTWQGKKTIFFSVRLPQKWVSRPDKQKTQVAIETRMPSTRRRRKCRPIFLLSWLLFLLCSSACLHPRAVWATCIILPPAEKRPCPHRLGKLQLHACAQPHTDTRRDRDTHVSWASTKAVAEWLRMRSPAACSKRWGGQRGQRLGSAPRHW